MRLGLSQDQEQVPTRSASDSHAAADCRTHDQRDSLRLCGQIQTPGETRQSCAGCDQHQHRRWLCGRGDWLQLHPGSCRPANTRCDIIDTLRSSVKAGWLVTNATPVGKIHACSRNAYSCDCGIDFKYSIVDSGSGRELQNQPIHNIAGLGEATGETAFPSPRQADAVHAPLDHPHRG